MKGSSMYEAHGFFDRTRIPEEFFGRVIKDQEFRTALLDEEKGIDEVRDLLRDHHIYVSEEGLEELEQLRSNVPSEVRESLEQMDQLVAS